MLAVKVGKQLRGGEGQRLQRKRVTPEKSGKMCLHFCSVSEVKETERVKSKSYRFEVGTPPKQMLHVGSWEDVCMRGGVEGGFWKYQHISIRFSFHLPGKDLNTYHNQRGDCTLLIKCLSMSALSKAQPLNASDEFAFLWGRLLDNELISPAK